MNFKYSKKIYKFSNCNYKILKIYRNSLFFVKFNSPLKLKKLRPQTNNALLSPPCTHYRRRSSVMFSDVVLLHGSNSVGNALQAGTAVSPGERNVCSSEKMTQTGDGNVWSSPLPDHIQVFSTAALRKCRILPTRFH